MRAVFMGTPDFAVSILDAVIEMGVDVTAVVTQPDRPKGRGKAVQISDVKARALELGLPVYQPVRIKKDPEFVELLRKMSPDVMVVAAFGQILPKEVLDIPRLGCINVHASLLPKYRGSAPIQWSVINGDRTAGVTTMQMDVGMDTGDMLEKAEIELAPDETGGSLFDRLAVLGAELIQSTLRKAEAGELHPEKQNEEEATHAAMLTKEMGDIDWSKDAESIERLIRGLNPWPSAFSALDGKVIKIWKAQVLPENASSGKKEAGEVVAVSKTAFDVKTGKGLLRILELQPSGKKRMAADAFLRGYPVKEGDRFVKA